MKKLSPKTIKAYSCTQLAKHLDRLMSKFDKPPYRVDLSYGKIFAYSESDDSYYFLYSIHDGNKQLIHACIDSAWFNFDAGATK